MIPLRLRERPSHGGGLIDARGLGYTVDGVSILRDVDFRIARGEIVTLVGPNGSGKTTLLRLLVGALRPTAGTLTRATGLRLGYAPQKLALDRMMPLTVDGFLALVGDCRAARAAALERVGLASLADRPLHALSGGQLQRALLARALLRAPDLLALDEPTQGLDQQGVADFYRLIEAVRRETGCAVLMVSHDLHVVMRAADRVVCLNGHVCCEGAPTAVTASPAWRALFGPTDAAALALYSHHHDHRHENGAPCSSAAADMEAAP